MSAGQRIELRPNAPKPHTVPAGFRIAFEDGHLVVIEKPSGITSVPYERKETGTALDLIRASWQRAGKRATATPLYTVHRIDKDTSGLSASPRPARRARAARGLPAPHRRPRLPGRRRGGRDGRAHRIAAGRRPRRRHPRLRPRRGRDEGQLAITHVEPLRHYARKSTGPAGRAGSIVATLCRVRLETGRTHQIRIHLSERGHPLVGETVYIRDLLRDGRQPLPSPRLMLHAAPLGLSAPRDRRADRACGPQPPADFIAVLESLGGARGDCRI